MSRTSLALSAPDRARLEEVERLAGKGPASATELALRLDDPSWAVRRAVVSALAELGEAAAEPLCAVLAGARDHEGRIAAAVDALSLARGDVSEQVGALLFHENPAVVCDAAQVLGRRRSQGAAPRLAELVLHPNDNVAVAAIEALGRVGGAAALDALIAATESGNFFRAFPAIDVLGRSGDARAVPPLVALLSDPLYAREAVRALGRSGQEAAVGPLCAVLARGDEGMLRVAAAALAELEHRHWERHRAPGVVVPTLRAELPGEALCRKLAQAVRGADAAEQTALCRVLGWIGGDEAAACLLDLLDEAPAVAQAAAAALGKVGAEAEPRLRRALQSGDSAWRLVLLPLVAGSSPTAPEVVACLEDPDPAVRALACEALGRGGDGSAIAGLFVALGDPEPRVAQAAAAALQAIGGPEVEVRAREAARAADASVRRAALSLLAHVGGPEALETLVEATRDPDDHARAAAIQGLPLVPDPRAVEALLEVASHPSDSTRAAVMRAIGRAPRDPRLLDRLLAGLGDPNAWVRYYACQALGKLADPRAERALVERTTDAAGQVRVAAVEALSHFRGEAARAALRDAAESADGDVRRAALRGLGRTGAEGALPALLDAAGASDAVTRLVAVSALGGLEAPEAVAGVRHAASDADERVRYTAIDALAARPGRAATEALVALLRDQGVDREHVLRALSVPQKGRPEALRAALGRADEETAPLLLATLAKGPDAEAALEAALALDNAAARRAAAAMLASRGSERARGALARLAEVDPDPEVRRIAASAAC